MFRHVVLIGFIPEATEQQRQSLLAELHRLPGAIPEIRQYVVGFDAGLAEGNADLAVVADFDDVEAYRVYAGSNRVISIPIRHEDRSCLHRLMSTWTWD